MWTNTLTSQVPLSTSLVAISIQPLSENYFNLVRMFLTLLDLSPLVLLVPIYAKYFYANNKRAALCAFSWRQVQSLWAQLSTLSGANVNRTVSGESALHTAARMSCPEIVSILLEHGADHNLRNPEGKLPMDLAPSNSLMAKLLKEVGGTLNICMSMSTSG